MSPQPVNNIPPLAHGHAANTGLRGGKINRCSAALTISIVLVSLLFSQSSSLCLCGTWMCRNSQEASSLASASGIFDHIFWH